MSAPEWLTELLELHRTHQSNYSYTTTSVGEMTGPLQPMWYCAKCGNITDRAHVAEVVWAEIERRLDTPDCYGGDDNPYRGPQATPTDTGDKP